jgi:hypothetical protein
MLVVCLIVDRAQEIRRRQKMSEKIRVGTLAVARGRRI